VHLEIDSGELESLNSMIKSAMGLANNTNMSLELLSARVNTRKTLMMSARSQGGRGKNTLAELKPIAMSLARSSTLYQGFERQALDDVERWAPATPVNFNVHKPETYNPGVSLSAAQLWAIKYNKLFMKAARHHHKRNQNAFVFGMVLKFNTHTSGHVVAELMGRTCQTLALHPVMSRDNHQRIWKVPDTMDFQSSLSAIAFCFADLKEHRQQSVDLTLVELHVVKDCGHDEPGSSQHLFFEMGTEFFVATLKFRKPYERRETGAGSGAHVGALMDGILFHLVLALDFSFCIAHISGC